MAADNPVVLVFGGIVALIAVAAVVATVAEKRRREARQALARQLGLAFTREDDGFAARYPELRLFSLGRSRRARNVLAGDHEGGRLWLLDYEYVIGSGKGRVARRQTVCLLEWPGLRLAHFFLRRQIPFLDHVGRLLGGQDIDVPADPEFSRLFVLQGEDAEATQAQFGLQPLRQHFVRQHRKSLVQCEGSGNRLLLHSGRLLAPREARALVHEAVMLVGLLSSAARGSA
jgi:hypothetical protein